MKYRNITLSAIGIILFILAGCENENSKSSTESVADTPAKQSPQTLLSSPNTSIKTNSTIALPTTSLDRKALFGLVSEEILETAPCPFLSDSTAISTANTGHKLLRREVSNEECRWSKNAGFSIKVTIAPLATATPLKDRAYNIDTPPVMKAQSGPGENAVILYDTAWDKELPYAIGFEQYDKLIEVFVTGMDTTPKQLLATANEISAKLPTAQIIERQRREIKPALDFCDIWPGENLDALVGMVGEETLHKSPYGAAGCKWSAGYGSNAKNITLARYKQGDTKLDRMIELGGKIIADLGDGAVILTRPATDGYSGDTAIWVDIDQHQFNLTLSGTIADHGKVAESLIENLFIRMN